ncbi:MULTISPECIES: hypothetical protein [unclassified Variovorax]|uniref:hypothetical protein n=1 Tax=unclassified Variovorax TaxID=663243 RepID=UPI00076D6468|nr:MULTISPECIES: hypothetical protein [unclassified Variovorax]KWT83719.1 hypothetical protein APY03_4274 [Variovorax sp. WDL1]PNG46398.1 hypothetical protein CHC06_06739 [Variovorax sp. B2]PNG47780.1 hypothetical protein CHC07_06948 [Variovorax sp. B4]VTV14134.1 hypothetical protein WDL1CHR_04712 [Variovorax sp. WDL1]
MVLPSLSHREYALLVFFASLLVTAFAGPALPSPELGGAPFADSRAWHGLPNAMDVLSNLPFAAIGIWGLARLLRLDRAREAAQPAAPPPSASKQPGNALGCARMFFAGLILTAAGSAFYHLHPDSLRLAADRAGMAVAFAGIVGVAVCDRASPRAGWPAAWLTLAGGLLAVGVFLETGNVLPWALVQFGGMAVLLALALARPMDSGTGFKPAWVILLYGMAKLFELSDHAIFAATHELVSGHTLKHLAAALAALPVLHAVRAMGRQALRQDPGTPAMTA